LGRKGMRRRIAYERLFFDVLRDRRILFIDAREIELAWRWVDGVAASWAGAPLLRYPAGGAGPRSDFADSFAPLV
jgi:glucose-6-phosphate 1-dehydrogenase